MNTSRVDVFAETIHKNGIRIKITNRQQSDGEPYSCDFKYPDEFEDLIVELDDEKLNEMNYKKMKYDDGIVHREVGYSYGLKDSFIDHVVILKNPNKIPMFEYMMYDVLTLLINQHQLMPTCRLDDFYKALCSTSFYNFIFSRI